MKLQFSRQIFETGPVEAELFHAEGRTDRQTDMKKLTVAFRSFANETKNDKFKRPWSTA
jgi:hypothetical protein